MLGYDRGTFSLSDAFRNAKATYPGKGEWLSGAKQLKSAGKRLIARCSDYAKAPLRLHSVLYVGHAGELLKTCPTAHGPRLEHCGEALQRDPPKCHREAYCRDRVRSRANL